jgi:hypothetical protein
MELIACAQTKAYIRRSTNEQNLLPRWRSYVGGLMSEVSCSVVWVCSLFPTRTLNASESVDLSLVMLG